MKAITLLFSVMTAGGVWAGMEERGAVFPQDKVAPPIKAVISGVEEGEAYVELPPVLVELERMPRRAAVWVELYRGPAGEPRRGIAVRSRLFRQPGGKAILDVPGIKRACEVAGNWTVVVMTGERLNARPLAHTTFRFGTGVAPAVPVALRVKPARSSLPPAE